jgi:hypothetical protein
VFHYYILIGSKVWDSSKGRIFRIKVPLLHAAARVTVYTTTGQWNPHPSVQADRREGRLHRRSRCGLEKSAMPSHLTGIANQRSPIRRVGLYSPVKSEIRDHVAFAVGSFRLILNPRACHGVQYPYLGYPTIWNSLLIPFAAHNKWEGICTLT